MFILLAGSGAAFPAPALAATPDPTASFTWAPAQPQRAGSVTLTSTSTAPPGHSITWIGWDIDDGVNDVDDWDSDWDDATGPSVTLPVLRRAGDLVVRLAIRDSAGGNDSVVHTIPVRELPLEDVPPPSSSVTLQAGAAHAGFVDAPDPALPLTRNWERDLGGRVTYSVVADGAVFLKVGGSVGSGSGDAAGSIVALDAQSGSTLWRRVVPLGSTAPAVADGRVFFEGLANTVVAVSADTGQTLWATEAPFNSEGFGVPTVYDGILYVSGIALDADSGEVLHERVGSTIDSANSYLPCGARDRVSGLFQWVAQEPCDGDSMPTVHRGRLYQLDAFRTDSYDGYAVSTSGDHAVEGFESRVTPAFRGSVGVFSKGSRMIARDVDTGALLWEFDFGPGDAPQTAPLIVGTTVMVASQRGRLVALGVSVGEKRWEGSVADAPDDGYPWDGAGRLSAGEGRIFVSSVGGRILAFGPGGQGGDPGESDRDWGVGATDEVDALPDPASTPGESNTDGVDARHSGFLNVTEPVPPLARAWHRDLRAASSRPVVGNGKVFVTRGRASDRDARVFAFDADTGETSWEQQLPVEESFQRIQPQVAYDDGRVFVGGPDRFLRAYSAATGTELWVTPISGGAWDDDGQGQLIVPADGVVYTQYGHAIDAATGAVLWLHDFQDSNTRLTGAPLVEGDRVIYTDDCGRAAVDRATGETLWGTLRGVGGCWGRAPFATTHDGRVFAAQGGRVVDLDDGSLLDLTAGLRPAIAGDLAVFSTHRDRFDVENEIIALNADTLEPRWRWAPHDLYGRYRFRAPPLIVGRHVYLSTPGWLFVLDLATGALVDERELLPWSDYHDPTDYEFRGGMAAGEDAVVVANGTSVDSFVTRREVSGPPETFLYDGASHTRYSALLTYGASIPDSTFECRIDDEAWESCPPQGQYYTYSGVSYGRHEFEVRAISPAGVPDPTSEGTEFFLYDKLPDTSIRSRPDATNERRPSFVFDSAPEGLAFECKLDTGTWAQCASPWAPSVDLPDGGHTLRVRSVDGSGTVDGSPAAAYFVVDTVSPDTAIQPLTSDQTNRQPSFEISSNEHEVRFECRLDDGEWANCSSHYRPGSELSYGTHTLQARANDRAGNQDPSPAVRVFTVATSPGPVDPPPDLPEVSVGDAAVWEGDAGESSMQVTLTLSTVSSEPVVARYRTTNYTAEAPGDYTAVAAGETTFPPGETTRSISLQIVGDVVDEPDEAFVVGLTGATNAAIDGGDAWGAAWIVDDDPTVGEEPPEPPVDDPPLAAGLIACDREMRGTPRPDRLVGGEWGERISGLGASDRLAGGGGPDCLSGGRGDDRLDPGTGFDVVDGGPGSDRVLARDGEPDVVRCGGGKDRAAVDTGDLAKGCEKVRRR
jgi:outer membrane protein assembly factor BamB